MTAENKTNTTNNKDKPKVLIMSGYGINCETESAHAFEIAGGLPEIVHINDLIAKKKSMDDFDIMMFPGGFSYGDDTGSGNAFANKVKNNLWDSLLKFIKDGKLVLGVCNGFQVMTNLGLFALNEDSYGTRIHAMEANTHARYECRWVHIKHGDSKCVFTKDVEITHLPIAHGEGRFYCDDATYKKLKENNQIVFTYCDKQGNDAEGIFPLNPNGARNDIAGITDISGRMLGMMPHPERALYSVSEPEFQENKEIAKRRGKDVSEMIDTNFKIFQNAIDYVKENKGERM